MKASLHLLATSALALLLAGCARAPHDAVAPTGAPVSATAPATPDDPIEVAVTIDDLPHHGPDVPGVTRLAIHEEMLRVIAAHRMPPVYGFINGAKLESQPEERAALEAWRRAGQPLGNHSYSHPDIEKIGLDGYLADIDRNEGLLRELAGSSPKEERAWKVFRYPYLREGTDLASREKVREHLAARGYRIAEVTIDFYDWAFNAPYARCLARGDARAVKALEDSYVDNAMANLKWSDGAARTLLGRPIPQILLLHVGAFDAHMLDALFTEYEKAHVRWVSLDAALADPVYASEPKAPKVWLGNFLNQIRRARGTRAPSYPMQPEDLLDALCR